MTAPSKESSNEPSKPATAPYTTRGHWGAAECRSFTSSSWEIKYAVPTVAPPSKLATRPTTVTPPLVPVKKITQKAQFLILNRMQTFAVMLKSFWTFWLSALTICKSSIYFFLLIRGQVPRVVIKAVMPRLPFFWPPPPAHSLSGVSWVFPGASSQCVVPETPSQGDALEASAIDAKAPSAGPFLIWRSSRSTPSSAWVAELSPYL